MTDSTASSDSARSMEVPCVRGDPCAAAAFLVRVGEELASSLDYATTLQAVARQAVPFLADICVVELVSADGRLRPVAVEHADPEKQDWVRDMAVSSGMESPAITFRALRTREPVIVTDEGASVELVVEDGGPGISDDDLERIFDRFYPGRAVEHSETPGSGLGLSLARMIMVAHGGKIRAENRPEGGARFTVTLPAAS